MSTPSRGWCAPLTKIVRAPRTGNATLILLSPRLHCFATHWDGRREHLCWREIGQPCPRCTPANGHQRSYYAVARGGPDKPEPVVLHMPYAAVQYCPALLNRADNCRGLVVRVERVGKAHAVKATVEERQPDPERLTDSGEWLVPYLMRLWGIAPEQIGDLDLTYLGTGTTAPAIAEPPPVPVPHTHVCRSGARPGMRTVGRDGAEEIVPAWMARVWPRSNPE